MVNKELAIKVVDFLNEMLKIDRDAILALVDRRVLCNKDLADHATAQVASSDKEMFQIGLLGILNGLCGIDEDGQGYVAAEYYKHGLVRFCIWEK